MSSSFLRLLKKRDTSGKIQQLPATSYPFHRKKLANIWSIQQSNLTKKSGLDYGSTHSSPNLWYYRLWAPWKSQSIASGNNAKRSIHSAGQAGSARPISWSRSTPHSRLPYRSLLWWWVGSSWFCFLACALMKTNVSSDCSEWYGGVRRRRPLCFVSRRLIECEFRNGLVLCWSASPWWIFTMDPAGISVCRRQRFRKASWIYNIQWTMDAETQGEVETSSEAFKLRIGNNDISLKKKCTTYYYIIM